MLRITLSAIAASLLALTINVDPAQAQSRVFVAAEGSDANPCTFALPCRSFQKAHDTVAAGGEIDVLDPAGYGAVIINKSISIRGHGFSGISIDSGGTAISINIGLNDAVHLSGLMLEGGQLGQIGIYFFNAGTLVIQDCVVRNFTSSGMAIAPAQAANIAVTNTLVEENGGHGIYVQPTGSFAPVEAFFTRVESYHNGQMGIGVFGNTANGFSYVDASVVESAGAFNAHHGFYALGGGAATSLKVFHSTTMGNLQVGILADNASTVSVALSNLNDHAGVAGSGCLQSYGDNYSDGIPFANCGTILKY